MMRFKEGNGAAKDQRSSPPEFSMRREIRSFYLWVVYCIDLTLSVPALAFPVFTLLTVYVFFVFFQMLGLRLLGM